jgi:chromosome segregation protein
MAPENRSNAVYLKSLHMVGFKSFANATTLSFEPGMTAIVGPNGCGKSNVSDAVRWVLGETSAKALRGSKMEDVIFNGTDTRKPLGMAEVSITFADCEKTLGTDYNEVTVTRRVFRSGEGQYFLNKTPCRLKDIARLFMDTGIGTSSYSLMEQGRIDQVLSSRPEDRREIFEEASGITRYKADKKEALRKLDQTEANLLRLDDVVREVKRQIGSLQRQAGKARRYKELRDELRKFDVYWTARKLEKMDGDLHQLDATIAELGQKINALHTGLQQGEAHGAAERAAIVGIEHAIGEATEERATAQTRLEHNHDLIRINRDRINELRQLADRDRRDSVLATSQAEQQHRLLADLEEGLVKTVAERNELESNWNRQSAELTAHETQTENSRQEIQSLRGGAMSLDNAIAQQQNQLGQLEARQQAAIVQRERLSAEHNQIERGAAETESHLGRIADHLGSLQQELEGRESRLETLQGQRHEKTIEIEALRKECGELQANLAVKKAQIEILEADDQAAKDFPEGARLIMDAGNPLGINTKAVLGALASHIQTDPEYRTALESVLRAWLDAVVIAGAPEALSILNELQSRKAGAARLIATSTTGPRPETAKAPDGLRPLFELITCTSFARPAVERFLANVFVAGSSEQIPATIPEGAAVVTLGGIVARSNGAFEYWSADSRTSNPLTRRHQLSDLHEGLEGIDQGLSRRNSAVDTLAAELAELNHSITQATTLLTEQRRAVALKEGEFQVVSNDARQAKQKLEVMAFELGKLREQAGHDEERQTLSRRINEGRAQQAEALTRLESLTRSLQDMESRRAELQTAATEVRLKFSEARQKAGHMESQMDPLRHRLTELTAVIKSRSEGLVQYENTIEQLTRSTTEAEGQLSTLQENASTLAEKLEGLKRQRTDKVKELTLLESDLAAKRERMDDIREQRSKLEVNNAEQKMRRQNLIERVTGEWSVTLDDVMKAPIPEQEGEPAPGDINFEQRIAEIRTKIEAMGPVNLVAIEEYQEHEERYAFLTSQQQDLVNAKNQLMEMIKKINLTTSELFATTFAKINENFQIMYERLFNGGSAKLVMVTEDDVLESGIDIIARPPGKRLQSVSLLSGGERTMTAVALLFSIYMIKPSPFCLLDELDAALDESNIGRFVKVLGDFLQQSQFIVITHNRRTIAAAGVIYGVTMQESGISRTVSMKFNEYEQSKDMQAGSQRNMIPAK